MFTQFLNNIFNYHLQNHIVYLHIERMFNNHIYSLSICYQSLENNELYISDNKYIYIYLGWYVLISRYDGGKWESIAEGSMTLRCVGGPLLSTRGIVCKITNTSMYELATQRKKLHK